MTRPLRIADERRADDTVRILPVRPPQPAPPPDLPSPSPWRARLVTAAVASPPMALMAVVATIGAGTRPLWRNEYLAWYAGRLSVTDLWRLVNHVDMDKVAYFAGLHLWVGIVGDSPLAMRAPSIAAMAIAAGAIALVGRKLFGVLAGLLAGLLMAGVPALSQYGAEVSAYAAAAAAVTVSTLLLLHAYERPAGWRWIAYAVSVTVIGYLHLVALTVLAAHWLIHRHARKATDPDADAPEWAVSVIFGLIPVAPLVWVSHGQSWAIAWIKTRGHDIAAYPTNLFASAPAAALVCFTALAGALLLWARRVHRWKIAALALWAVLPPTLGALTSPWTHLFLPRYYLFTLPAVALLFAVVVTSTLRLTRMHRLAVAVLAAVLVAGVAVVGYPGQRTVHDKPIGSDFDVRDAFAAMARQEQRGDGIAFAGDDISSYARQAMAYELRGKARPRDVFARKTPAKRGLYDALECAKPAGCLGGTTRVWLLSSAPGKDPLAQAGNKAIADLLRKQFNAGPVQRFRQVRLVLLTRKPPAPPAPPAKVAAKVAPAKPARPAPTATKQGGTR